MCGFKSWSVSQHKITLGYGRFTNNELKCLKLYIHIEIPLGNRHEIFPSTVSCFFFIYLNWYC